MHQNYNDESFNHCVCLLSGLVILNSIQPENSNQITGMQFKDYLRCRKLAFALKEIRDSDKRIMQIALGYGFSSHEAFTRAFKNTYGVTPSHYRANPQAVILRTKIQPFDRYF